MVSPNKLTVEEYLEGFRQSDPGMFLVRGKDAFDREIENDAFEGSPQILRRIHDASPKDPPSGLLPDGSEGLSL